MIGTKNDSKQGWFVGQYYQVVSTYILLYFYIIAVSYFGIQSNISLLQLFITYLLLPSHVYNYNGKELGG